VAGVETPTVGELIAYHRRRRGLSQARFAELLDRSVSWVSQVERGVKPVDRLPVLREVARVLEVPPAELLPESMLPEAADREHPAAKAIRLVLSGHPSLAAELAAGSDVPAPSIDLEDLEARVRHAWELAHASRFLEMGELIADLIPELEAAARQLDGEPQRTAFRLLADTYQATTAVLTKLGETAAAWAAAERSVAAAERAGLPKKVNADDLRHIALTNAAEAGVSVKWAAELAGHESGPGITLKHYIQNTKAMSEADEEKVRKAYGA